MPQLSQIAEIYASQLFWLAIVFALIYFGIGRAMVPRIEATIDDRAARIKRDLDAAEAARATAQSASEAYEAGLAAARATMAKTLQDAKAAAAAKTETTVKAGDATSAEQLAAATGRIEVARAAAMTQIEDSTVEAVETIVTRLSGAHIDHAAIAGRVKSELARG